MMSGVFEGLLSRILPRLRPLFPPEVTGLVVTMVGLELVGLGAAQVSGVSGRRGSGSHRDHGWRRDAGGDDRADGVGSREDQAVSAADRSDGGVRARALPWRLPDGAAAAGVRRTDDRPAAAGVTGLVVHADCCRRSSSPAWRRREERRRLDVLPAHQRRRLAADRHAVGQRRHVRRRDRDRPLGLAGRHRPIHLFQQRRSVSSRPAPPAGRLRFRPES